MTALEERVGTVGVQLNDSILRWRQSVTAFPVTPAATGAARRVADERRQRVRVNATDVGVILASVMLGLAVQLTGALGPDAIPLDAVTAAGLLTIIAWLVGLSAARTRDSTIMARGGAEYYRVLLASVFALGVLCIGFAATGAVGIRPFLIVSLPVGAITLLASRAAWRLWVRRQRMYGHQQSRALIVGSRSSIAAAAQDVQNDPSGAYRVAGTLILDRDARPEESFDAVRNAMLAHGADCVIVTGRPSREPQALRRLAWALEGTASEVIVPSGIGEVSSSRIRVHAMDDERFVRVALPTFAKKNHVKRAFDVAVSAAMIVALSPVFACLALAIKISSPGPVFYRQVRVGLNGHDFRMIKFRSMRIGADAELAQLLAEQGLGDTPLFKIKDDPRITTIGRFIRKYSLDELPQLFNVFGGSMSLVGPRPQIADEVALYRDGAERRLLTPPGVTGLWQVSGRSALSWEQAMRLDLYYVENWSLAGDLAILARTARAVVAPGETAH